MTLSTPVLRGGAAGSPVPVEAIDTVLRRTEDTFVWAG